MSRRFFALALAVVGLCGMKADAQYPFAPNSYAANPYASNPYAANSYAPNPYAANPYAANPYAPNVYAPGPYAANPYAPGPYSASPYGNPYPVNPYSQPSSPYAMNPYSVNSSPYAVSPYAISPPSTGFTFSNTGTKYSVKVGRFDFGGFTNNVTVAPSAGMMPGYAMSAPSSIFVPTPSAPPSGGPAVIDLSGIDLDAVRR
jgi:hypothetical protein